MKTFKQFITEKRSNPVLNTKSTFMDELRAIIEKNGDGRYFVSFTEHNKIGVNPKSKYETPLGIYFYPVEFVLGHKSTGDLPFAGDRKYAQVVRARPGATIVDLVTMTEKEETALNRKALDVYVEYARKHAGYSGLDTEAKTKLDNSIKSMTDKILELSNFDAKVRKHGGRFWYVTMRVSNLMCGSKLLPHSGISSAASRTWNSLFRNIGVDACVDNGAGIIHPNERTQALFFDKSGLEHVDTIMNNYSASAVKFSPELAEEFFKSNKLFDQRDIFLNFGAVRDECDEKTFNTIMRYWWYAMERCLKAKSWDGYFRRERAFVGAVHSIYEDSPKNIRDLLKGKDTMEWLKSCGVEFGVLVNNLNRAAK